MGAMNKGGNSRLQCTGICNQQSVVGEYHCPVCKAFTDDKKCVCCGSPVAGHAVGKNIAVAGTGQRNQKAQNYGKYVSPTEAKRRKKSRVGVGL